MKNNFRRLLRFVFILFFCLPVLTTNAYDIANLKGTRSILPPSFRELSVLDGAIAWNTGTIRRLYDLGVLQAKDNEPTSMPMRGDYNDDEAYKEGKKIFNEELNKWTESIESTSVREVVRKLFYRQPGTTSSVDFNLTERIGEKNKDNNEFAKSMANVLSDIWLYHQISEHLKEEKALLFKNDELSNQLSKQEQENVKALLFKNDDLSKQLLRFKLSDLLPGLGSGDAVKKSLNDTVFDGYEVLRYSLLAALWVKCGSDREALKNYYVELTSALNKKIEIYPQCVQDKLDAWGKKMDNTKMPPTAKATLNIASGKLVAIKEKVSKLKESWLNELSQLEESLRKDTFLNETFNKDPKPDLIEKIKAFGVEQLQDPVNYELFTYFMLMPSKKPDDAHYDTAHLTINGNNENIAFPDCMDNVFRNLINHLAYDPETTRFSVDKLREITGKTVAKETVNAKLITFYATHSDAKKTTEPSAHDDWADMISDIPWVEYCKVLRGETNLEKSDRYIKIPESNLTAELNGFLVSHGYRRVEEREAIVYEVQPCLRNLIIVLDYLLNLGIFEGKNLSKEFIKDDFVSTYLPKVFEKFGTIVPVEGEISSDVATPDVEALDKVEFQDGKTVKIGLRLTDKYYVDISITIRGHGEFSSETLVREERPLIFSLMTSGDLKELPVSMQLLLPQAIFKKPGFNDNVVSFFTQDIGNPSICSDLLEFHIGLNETKIKLLKLLISRNNDASLGQHYLLSLYIQLVDANMEKFYEEAKTAAKEGVNSLHPVSQGLALDLWKALLEKDQGFKALDFQDAIFAATKGENNSNRFVWDSALNLWKALVEKVQGVKEPELKKQVFEGAIAAATKVMNKLKHVVRKSVLDLWKALVEKVQGVQDQVLKKQGFDKAIDAARDGMHSFHPEVQISALDLWKALFENGEGLADAQDYLSKMSDTNYFKKAFEQLINEYKPKFEQASLANIVPAGLQPAVAAQVPAA